MTSILVLLLAVALIVSILAPVGPIAGNLGDRENERLLADLRARPDYRPDLLPRSLRHLPR